MDLFFILGFSLIGFAAMVQLPIKKVVNKYDLSKQFDEVLSIDMNSNNTAGYGIIEYYTEFGIGDPYQIVPLKISSLKSHATLECQTWCTDCLSVYNPYSKL